MAFAENGFFFNLSHRGTGYTIGYAQTIEHHVIPGQLAIHVGLSRVQATQDGPVGAAVGIMVLGAQDFGPDPANWQTAAFGTISFWITAGWVNKGDMSGWEFFDVLS
jgi:hypothetical protein